MALASSAEDFEDYITERARLIDFLYILARDHLPVGTLESIMFDQVDTEPSSYCNCYLEEYARDLADRLLDLERPITDWKHMHKSADSKIKWCGEQNRPSNG